MKRLSFLLVCMICCITTMADEWTDPDTGYTWSYSVNGQFATIEKNKWAKGDLVIPATINGYSVTSIGDLAFFYCSGLTSITIPNSVTSIGNQAFYNCSGLSSITIPNSVTSIGYFAFEGCSGLTSVHISDLAAWCNISFSDNPLSYANHLFLNGTEVTFLVIPNSVTSIGYSTFANCSGLTSVIIPNSVTSIGNSAFRGCSNLKSITIPNSVTSIGHYAFEHCSNLSSITIPNSVTSIGYYAFGGCSGLTSVTIGNSVTSICDGAFYGCSGLTSVTIPNSMTSIGYFAFGGCSGLTSVTIPNSVTSIDGNAFYGCSGLTSVTIPNSVTSIGDGAFEGCSGLTSVTIGNSVTSIGESAFYGCSGLTSVTIPNSVTSIGDGAFYSCNKLTSVVSKMDNPSSINSECFPNNVFKNTTLYVPQGTIDKYLATESWNKFLHIKELNSSNMCATPTISYKNGKLSCNSETEGAIRHTTITNEDIKSFDDNEIDLTVTYNISVYATKDGYFDSDVANATLCWIEVNPQNEGITTDVNQIASVAVLIKANGGQLTIEGADDNTTVAAYTLDGVQLGSAVSKNGVATINTNVSAGTVTIVKIGSKSVKIVMQ